MHAHLFGLTLLCERCAHPTGMFLPATSLLSTCDHFCCDRCGHVWTLEKCRTLASDARPAPEGLSHDSKRGTLRR
jgi:hypothetical protein